MKKRERERERERELSAPRLRTTVEILRDGSERLLAPRIAWSRIDATTEAEIAAQIAEDDARA